MRVERCMSQGGLHIAASSYTTIIVLFLLPITIFICIDYRKTLVDLPSSLLLRDGSF